MAADRLTTHDLPLLDGVRALAALMVLTTHVGFQTGMVVQGAWGAAVARLDLGVALFFVLSGFLLLRPWLATRTDGRAGPSTRRYLVRRAVRILPAYWIVLAVALATTASGAGVRAAATNAALLQVYRGPLLPGLTQTWSLCTEVAFYVVLPLVAVPVAARARTATGRRGLALLLAAVVAVALMWTALATAGVLSPRSTTWLPAHADWFAAGMSLAVLEQVVRRRPGARAARLAAELGAHPGTLVALAGAVFWLAATPLGGPASLEPVAPATAAVKEGLYAVVAVLLVGAAAASDQRRGAMAAVLGHRAVQGVGRVSYGVFLWHLLVLSAALSLLHRSLFSGGFWPVLALTLGGSIAVASGSWVVLEAPLLRRVHRPREGEPAPEPTLPPRLARP